MTEKLPSEIMFERLNMVAKMRGLPEKANWVGPKPLEPPRLAFPEDFFLETFNDVEVNVKKFAEGFGLGLHAARDVLLTRNLTEFQKKDAWVCNEVNNIYRANIFTDAFFCQTMLAAVWNNGKCRKGPVSEMTGRVLNETVDALGGKNGVPGEILDIHQAMGIAVSELRKLTESEEHKNKIEVLKLKTNMKKNEHLFGGVKPKDSV